MVDKVINAFKDYIWKYKIAIVFVIFVFWVLFIDDHSLLRRREVKKEIAQLNETKEFYLSKIKEDSISLYMLQNSTEELERIAREEYFYKKKNEDIFIIVDENGIGVED